MKNFSERVVAFIIASEKTYVRIMFLLTFAIVRILLIKVSIQGHF